LLFAQICAGLNVSEKTEKALLMRYSNKNGNITFNDFVACYVKLKSMLSTYYCLYNSFYAQQLYRQVLLRARISYGNSVRLSLCPGVTTRYRIKPMSDRDTGFSPYDSLEFLVR